MTQTERRMIREALAQKRSPAQEDNSAREIRHSIEEAEYERAMVAKALRAAGGTKQ